MNNIMMSPNELRKEIEEFLLEHKDGALATCDNNVPRSSPVQYCLGENLQVYILSAGGEKFKAIKNNPNVCMLVNSEYLNFRQIKGVQIFGLATTSIENPSLYNEARNYLTDKYVLDNEKDNLKVIKIVPNEIVYLDSLVDGDRTKQVLKGNEVYIMEDSSIFV